MDKISQNIIKVLEDHPSGVSITDIAKNSTYHRNTISPRLNALLKENKVKVKTTGKSKLYYLTHHAMIAEGSKHRMEIDKKNVFVGVGYTDKENPKEAAKQLIDQALEDLKKDGSDKPILGIVFCSAKKYASKKSNLDKFVRTIDFLLREKNKDIEWFGCTTAGEISNKGVTEESCVAMLISSKYIHQKLEIGEHVSKNPKKVGSITIKRALDKLKLDKYLDSYIRFLAIKKKTPEALSQIYPYSVFMIPSGSTLNYPGYENELIEGITEITGRHIPILGGSAGDDFIFKDTYLFANGKVYLDSVLIYVGIFDILTGIGIEHGYISTDKSVRVTKVEGKVVKEFDNKPALEVYAELLSTSPEKLNEIGATYAGLINPFAISDQNGKFWVKSPHWGINKKDILFYTAIPKNTVLTLMNADKNKSINATKQAILNSKIKDSKALIIFNCGGRKSYLNKDVLKENEKIREAIGEIPYIGFYTYGEIGFSRDIPPSINNGTTVIFNLSNKLLME